MPQPFDRSSHKLHKRQQIHDELLETTRGPVPAKDIKMTYATGRTTTTTTTTIGVTMTTTAITTMTAAITIAATTTIVATMIMIRRMIIVGKSIATTLTPTDGTQEITKGTTDSKTYARSDGVHPTTTRDGHAPHGPNHHVPRSNKNINWYR